MSSQRARYRARMEWDGVELFDREDGRVFQLEKSDKEILTLMLVNLNNERGDDIAYDSDSSLNHREIRIDDIEPLIDTPFAKTSSFASTPRRVYWEVTRSCNLDCRACFNRFNSTASELSTNDIIEIANAMYQSGVYEIRCTGGEPTLRPDFFEIIDELSSMGFYLSVGTNGHYSPTVWKKIMVAPLDWIIISIDGSDAATHEHIRGENTFIAVIKSLHRLAEKDCRIRVNTLIRKDHYKYEHLLGLVRLCDQCGVESLNCIPLRPVTNDAEAVKLQLTRSEFREFIGGLQSLRSEFEADFVTTLDLTPTTEQDRVYQKDRSCAAGREGAVISPYGEIYGCSYSKASMPDLPAQERALYVAGNLLHDDFLQIWNESDRWAIYRDLKKYKHRRCQVCKYYTGGRCIGNCPIMDPQDPAAFDPYCYLYGMEGGGLI